MSTAPAPPPPSYRTTWLAVLGLVGLDYFSTLAYQPSIAFEAAGRLAPLATAAIVLLTCLGALPIYAYIVARTPPGHGSISMLERLVPGWRGKLLILILLGFAATNFVFTRTLSTADAAVHALNNPSPNWQAKIENLAEARELVRPVSDNSTWLWFWDHFWNRQIATTLLLLVLTFFFWQAAGKSFTRRFIRFSTFLVAGYLLLTAFIIGSGLFYLARYPWMIEHWWADVRNADWLIDRPSWTEGQGPYGLRPGSLALMALWLLPKVALGLSGFEMSMTVVPLIKGDRAEQTRRARKLMLSAALLMAVFLLGSALVTTILMAPGSLLPGGRGHERALAALAHGEALIPGVGRDEINPLFGSTFGTIYDVFTILVLCLAGASVTLGLKTLLPQFLLRFGMEMRWAYAIGFIFHVFTAINLVVTILFRASVESQRSAYAVSVLMLMTSAAFATAVDLRQRGGFIRTAGALGAAVVTFVFAAMTLGIVIYHPGCLVIAGLFIVALVTSSAASRWYRASEFRFEGFEFVDDQARQLWDEVRHLQYSVLVPIHPGGQVSLDAKEAMIRQRHRVDEPAPLIFLECVVGDASEFVQRPLIEIRRESGRYLIRITRCVSIAHVIFAVGREFSKVGEPPEIHFGWSDQHPLAATLKFLIFGEGNIPYLVNDLLRRHEPDHTKRPRVVIG